MNSTSVPSPPTSRIGNPVYFVPPEAVPGGKPREGKIIDEIWSEVIPDSEWGWYVYTSQIIRWQSDDTSVRLTYYYMPHGNQDWVFGGQYSIEENLNDMELFLSKTLMLIKKTK